MTRRQTGTESPFTYSAQFVNTSYQWQLSWQWPRMTHAYAEAVNAWVSKLDGQVGSFRYYPRQAFASLTTNKTLAIPAYTYNNTMSVGGWSANTPSTLRAGQYCQVGDQLLLITDAGALADGSGHVTVSFSSAFRMNYAAGSVVNFTNPSGVFRLNASEGLGFTLDADRKPEFSAMAAREVVDAG